MSDSIKPTRLQRVGGCLSLIAFRFVPLLLILAIVWTGFQVFAAFIMQYNAGTNLESRRDAYQSTATAIAVTYVPAADQRATVNGVDHSVRLVQFATNTPSGAENGNQEATNGDSNALFATNTPVASPTSQVLPSATPQPPTRQPAGPPTTVALPTFFPPQQADEQVISGTAVPDKVPVIPRDYELINIVLLGGDDEVTADNTVRTDSIIIVSINTETRSVSMLSIPRDLFVYVPLPGMHRINTVYGIGESYGWSGGGFGLLREVIFYNLGIQTHYYAKVDFSGFREIIDTLGGIDMAVDCTYQDYFPYEQADGTFEYRIRTLPVGYYRFNGREALWYARTREGTLEFDRGRRQQLLLRAIWRAALQEGLLESLPTLWNDLLQVVETDVPYNVMLGLLPIGLELDPTEIEMYTMIYRYHTEPWRVSEGVYAGQVVQLPKPEPIAQLMYDFYQPPTSSQLDVALPSIAVYNGTGNPDWDKVAADTLYNAGFNAYAAGVADNIDYVETVIIDFTGEQKGSPIPGIMDELNVNGQNVRVEPAVERTSDYEVIIGATYDSCPATIVLD